MPKFESHIFNQFCFNCRRRERTQWINHWILNLVRITFAGPFIILDNVKLGVLDGHTALLLTTTEAWVSHLQSLHLLPLHDTTKSSITQYTVKPTLTVIPCDSFYLTQAYPLDALQLFSAAAIVSRINASDGTLRYFSVFRNYTPSIFYIEFQLFRLVVCSASVRDGAVQIELERRECECGFGISYSCVSGPKTKIHNKANVVKRSHEDPNQLWRGDLWDLHEGNLPKVMEEWGHFKSHYYVIKCCLSLLITQ